MLRSADCAVLVNGCNIYCRWMIPVLIRRYPIDAAIRKVRTKWKTKRKGGGGERVKLTLHLYARHGAYRWSTRIAPHVLIFGIEGGWWDYDLFYWKEIIIINWEQFFFVHRRMLSAVKRVEFVSYKLSYIVLRGRWPNIILVNVHAQSEGKSEGSKDSFMRN